MSATTNYHAQRIRSDPALSKLALCVERATKGSVYFETTVQPASMTYWVFVREAGIKTHLSAPYSERMTKRQARAWLSAVLEWTREVKA